MTNKPVAWMLVDEINGDYMLERHPSGDYDWIPLYTNPVKVNYEFNSSQVKELTDEEICKIFNEHTGLGIHQKEADKSDLLVFARAILLKAQEK